MGKQNLIAILSKLVAFNTDSSRKSNYLECPAYISSQLKKFGLKTKIFKFKGKDDKPRPNVFSEWNVGAKETVLFVTHFDTVPAGDGWKSNPFRVARDKNILRGRGVSDDKGGVAAFISAMAEMKKAGQKPKMNIKFLSVCDEEVGGEEGIGLVIGREAKILKSDFCITLDGNLDYISHSCCGSVRGTITFMGKGGHSAYDFNTQNVLHKTFPFLQELSKFSDTRRKVRSFIEAPKNPIARKMFGRFNITILHAGTQYNVIPDKFSAGFDLRLLPEENASRVEKSTRKMIIALAKKHKLKIRLETKKTSGYYSKPSKYESLVKKVAQEIVSKKLPLVAEFGGTDARYVSLLGIPAYNFCPGGNDIHTSKESIPIKNLEKTVEFIKKLVC